MSVPQQLRRIVSDSCRSWPRIGTHSSQRRSSGGGFTGDERHLDGELGAHDDGRTVSVWSSEVEARSLPPLDGAISTDVRVVGAGIAGLTTAYCAAREGLSVVVFEDGAIVGGQTKRTTAHLTSDIDD